LACQFSCYTALNKEVKFKMTMRPYQTFAMTTTDVRLYCVVAERINAMILDGQMVSGTRLPSERDLAARFNVSPTSVREALISLELPGIVEVRGGSGIFVSDKDAAAFSAETLGPGPFEVLVARRMIEGEIVAMAARMSSDRAIEKIFQAIERLEQSYKEREKSEQADRNFHLSIARATGNAILANVVSNLWDQRGHLWNKMEDHFQTEELRQETLKDHRRIAAAIAAHDPAVAYRAMLTHLHRVTRQFSRGWGAKDIALASTNINIIH
jgi:DNA-binding FadR family transcriptional regulator